MRCACPALQHEHAQAGAGLDVRGVDGGAAPGVRGRVPAAEVRLPGARFADGLRRRARRCRHGTVVRGYELATRVLPFVYVRSCLLVFLLQSTR